jgi:hypothetical protein
VCPYECDYFYKILKYNSPILWAKFLMLYIFRATIPGDQKVSVRLIITVQKTRNFFKKLQSLIMIMYVVY